MTTRYKFRKTFEQISLRAKQELSGSIFLLCRSPCIRGEGTYRPIRSSIATRCPSAVGLPSFTHFHFSAVDKLSNFSCLFNHLSAQLPLSPSHSKRRGNCQSGTVCFAPNRCSDLPYRPPGTVHCSHSFGIAAVPKNIILHLRRIFPPPFPSSLWLSFSLVPASCAATISALRSIWYNFWASTLMCSFFTYRSGLEASGPFCVMCCGYENGSPLKSTCARINCTYRVNAVGSWVTYNFAQLYLPKSLQL